MEIKAELRKQFGEDAVGDELHPRLARAVGKHAIFLHCTSN